MADSLQLPKIETFIIDSIEQLSDCLPHRSKYFTLLLAWDAPETEHEKLMEMFQPLVDRGLAYFCAWGSRCSEVHDAIDLCAVNKEQANGPADYQLMTTWHDDEPLDEALWFFNMCAIPAGDYVISDFERFAVAVGDVGWEREMRGFLSRLE
jgi:hypothetical protein